MCNRLLAKSYLLIFFFITSSLKAQTSEFKKYVQSFKQIPIADVMEFGSMQNLRQKTKSKRQGGSCKVTFTRRQLETGNWRQRNFVSRNRL